MSAALYTYLFCDASGTSSHNENGVHEVLRVWFRPLVHHIHYFFNEWLVDLLWNVFIETLSIHHDRLKVIA